MSRPQKSLRVQGLAVMLYLLGFSYGAVSLAMDALGVYLCKSRVYDTVQAVAERAPGLRREQVFGELKTPVLGGDLTSVKVNGQESTLGPAVDDTSGMVLTVDGLDGEDTETLARGWSPSPKRGMPDWTAAGLTCHFPSPNTHRWQGTTVPLRLLAKLPTITADLTTLHKGRLMVYLLPQVSHHVQVEIHRHRPPLKLLPDTIRPGQRPSDLREGYKPWQGFRRSGHSHQLSNQVLAQFIVLVTDLSHLWHMAFRDLDPALAHGMDQPT